VTRLYIGKHTMIIDQCYVNDDDDDDDDDEAEYQLYYMRQYIVSYY